MSKAETMPVYSLGKTAEYGTEGVLGELEEPVDSSQVPIAGSSDYDAYESRNLYAIQDERIRVAVKPGADRDAVRSLGSYLEGEADGEDVDTEDVKLLLSAVSVADNPDDGIRGLADWIERNY